MGEVVCRFGRCVFFCRVRLSRFLGERGAFRGGDDADIGMMRVDSLCDLILPFSAKGVDKTGKV